MNRYYLQDSRSNVGDNMMWWASGGNGYTSDLRNAQIYSEAEAQAQHNCRQSDVPWPVDYLADRTYLAVDMQYLGEHIAAEGECYAQLPGTWIGNDCLWLTHDGSTTTDVRQAAVFCTSQPGYVMWAKTHIDALSRPAVRSSDVRFKEAIAGSKLTIQTPTRPRIERLRCCQCNRFLSEPQFWSGSCPHCGADSRP